MSNLERLQDRLRALGWSGMLVPSTDEYLSEFAQTVARRLEWVTGFHGSTGLSIVLQNRAGLFVDGRYISQGERDCAGLGVEVLDAKDNTRDRWLAANLQAGDRLAIDTRLQSHPVVERIMRFAAQRSIAVVDISENPIDELWGAERPPAPVSEVFDYPTYYAGLSAAEKYAVIRERMTAADLDCLLVADPEDVAWLLNVRTHDCATPTPTGWHVVPIPLSRVLMDAAGSVFWSIEQSRLEPKLKERLQDSVTIIDPARFESFLEERSTGKVVGANLQKTPYRFAAIAARAGTLRNDPAVAHHRWRKHPNEIERAREAHFRDGQAVIRFMAWVQSAVLKRTVTEIDAAEKLTEFRREIPEYQGLSLALMSASGVSGAMMHYMPTADSNRKLNDHPIYWIDSGGQYYGFSTDNTVCIAVGKPAARHIRAHTLIVKGIIGLSCAQFPTGTFSSQLDSFAREHLWREGMNYNHGTGHGVGNFMNIHEGPYIYPVPTHPLVAPIEAGMIITNEPGYYSEGDFGIRVETHLLTVQSKCDGFIEFETISRLPIDPKLIDASLLTEREKQWLVDYHVRIREGYKGCFDEGTTVWLHDMVDAYASMGN
jgi:Xaa-Pro aminopeptidase